MSYLRAFSVFCGVFRASSKEARSTIPRSDSLRVAKRRSASLLGGYPRSQLVFKGGFMLESDEDEARATKRIIDPGTGETVGLLYVWEDGCAQPLWFKGVCENAELRQLENVST